MTDSIGCSGISVDGAIMAGNGMRDNCTTCKIGKIGKIGNSIDFQNGNVLPFWISIDCFGLPLATAGHKKNPCNSVARGFQ
jgi:hypothetical protein